MDGRRTKRHRGSAPPTVLTMLCLVWSAVAMSAAQDVHQRLWDSAAAGEIETIRTLLLSPEQIAVDSADAHGWTALMYAADAGHDSVVALLLHAGSSPHLKNAARVTPLHLAAQLGRTRVVQRLLEAGAAFEERDAEGRTPLFLAIDGGHAEVIGLLHGAARADVSGRSPALALTVEGETAPPVIIQWADPLYTEESLVQEIEGTVVLMVIVRQDGSVGAVSVSKGLDEGLDQNAVRSVQTWRFDPATRAGTPVPVVVAISVDFRLPEEP